MSHALTLTLTADEASLRSWEAALSDFFACTGLPLAAAPAISIAPRMGATTRGPPTPASRSLTMTPPRIGSPQLGSSMTSPMSSPKKTVKGGDLPANVSSLLDPVRASVRKHGAVGIATIGRKFRICDDNGDGTIDPMEFEKAMSELGFRFSPDQLRALYKFFDANADGKIDYEEFLAAVRPPMSIRRKRFVQKVFEMLDTTKDGVLTPEDLKARFNARGDIRVQDRSSTPEKVAAEFISTFDVFDHDGRVGPEEFCKYYQGVSASIDDDGYFELMLRNAWHMSGGVGQSQCTSCLHVCVEHSDGSETIEEVKNDLGLDKFNSRDVTKRLLAQGVTDIVKVKLFE
eukprot:NODE_7732_length_1554_cov_7.458304.p1 GENE.NODE_7732_length_1554_cov_7.458304~~NODE_7732_length_1554_cov_7.458304.p1  ORF type:complete len:345 (+),score=123.44 NODE_7732_length_1554_cov_7.458304:84-1118(+)